MLKRRSGSQSRPGRRRLQVRLSTLLLVSVAVGLWLGISARRVRIQRRAANQIEALGGQLTFRGASQGAWLGDALSHVWPTGRSDDVMMVSLYGGRMDDDTVKLLASLPRVEVIHLIDCAVTDDGLAHLAGLSRLRALVLSGSDGITDRGLEHLGEIESLAVVDLNGTNTSEEGRRRLEARVSGLQVD